MRGRQRGQVLIIAVAALPVLLGFLGLTVDGGYYFATTRAMTFAASAAARAVAVDLVAGRYAAATGNGQAIGQRDVQGFPLSNPTVVVEYSNTAAAPSTATWYSGTPSSSTRSIRATVRGTYRLLFLPFVGLSTLDVTRVSAVSFTGYQPTVMLPLAICRAAMDALDANPTTPQTLWQFNASLCGVSKWDGLVSLNGQTGCSVYQNWILPQPSAPPPAIGSTIALNTQNCQNTSSWIQSSSYYAANSAQPILVVDITPGTTSGVVFCYRSLTLAPGSGIIQVTPSSSASACSKDYSYQ